MVTAHDDDEPIVPRRDARPRTVALVAFVIVAILAVAYGVVVTRPGPSPRVPPVAAGAFGPGGVIRTASTKAAYSPDGASIAVLTADGVGIATKGRVEAFTRPGAQIVDFAWMPDSRRLLVMEGPVGTGFVVVVDLQGEVVAAEELSPPFAVGSGFGIDVDPSARRAVTVAVTRDPLGQRDRRDVVVTDLQTGVTRTLVDEEAIESRPAFLAGDEVVVTERRGRDSVVAAVNLASGGRRLLSPPGERAAVVNVISRGETVTYTTRGRGGRLSLWRVPAAGGTRTLLDRFEPGQTVVAVDASGRRALVSGPDPAAGEAPGAPVVLRDVVLAAALDL